MTQVKICGIKSIEDVKVINKYAPDYVGFVFAKSKRQITQTQAKKLKSELNCNIKTVGVFVNESIENIVNLCKNEVIDFIQLHGDEDEKYIKTLNLYIKNPVIKAVRVQNTQQILNAQNLPCQMLLLDTYTKNQYGGSGKTFDYTLIPKLEKPFFLAGGINEKNVRTAIKSSNPFCIDVSSGVETKGEKDALKIKNIIEIAKGI
ncbi:MAG: phosphoribosylanthranilate isomerase [Clostridiales bacterium]|nr:phosphoribosylanthranilate isomerase [Clostridiales bacterium]